MNKIPTAISGILVTLIAYLLFCKFGKIKFKKSVSIPVVIAATLLECTATLFFSGSAVMPLFFIASAFIITLLFDFGFLKKLLLSVLFFVISAAAETLSVYGVCAISGISANELKANNILHILSLIISVFFTLLAEQLIKPTKIQSKRLSPLFMAGVSVLPISSIFTLMLFFFMIYRDSKESLYIPIVVCSFLLIAANMSIFFIMNKQEEIYEEKAELTQTKAMLALEKSHYSELFAAQEELKQFRHDSKNFYTSLMASLRDNGAEGAAALIEKSFHLNGMYQSVCSGNAALDAVISSKIAFAKTQGVEISPYIRTAMPVRIEDVDIGILVGNALDNAVEASSTQGNKVVSLSIITSGEMLSIEVKNPVSPDFEIGNMKTTKTDPKNHGYGLKSIESIAEKYAGALSVKAENGEFVLSVILCNDKI